MKNKVDTFEDKLKKVDEILVKFEDDNLSLKESVNLYKTGSNLIKDLRKILENSKLEIEMINNER